MVDERYLQARRRVYDTPQLEPYADLILYQWPESDERWQWVIDAPVEEIIEWANSIQDEANTEE